MLRVRPETERQMDRRGCSQMWATAKYSATWGIRQLPGMCWHPAKRSICRGEPSSPANLMQQLRASGSGTDLSSASPCNDKKWAADTMYRPPLLFSVVKNGFQGVPERYKWVPHAMLANRRSRAGYPLRGGALLTRVRLRLAIYRGYGYNFLFFLIKISTLFYQAVI